MNYDYPDPDPLHSASASRLPYFGINDDESGAFDQIPYENVENGESDDNDDDNDADDVNEDLDDADEEPDGVPFRNPFSTDGTFKDDFPFTPVAEESSEEDDDSSSDSEPALPTEGEGRRDAARGRGGPRGRGRGGRRGGLAALLAKTDPDRHLKKAHGGARGRPRAPRGEGARGGRRGRRGPAKNQTEPSQEFKALQMKATTAFLDQNLEEALEWAKQAVQTNPEIFAAHSLLSQIYSELGMKEESLGVLWSGAHTQRLPGVWWEVARRTKEMNYSNEEMTEKQLLYCYSQIARLEPDDFDAHRGKLEIYMKTDSYGRTLRESLNMVRIRPYDLDSLQTLAALCIRSKDPQKAKVAYARAIAHYQTVQHDEHGGEFSFSDLNVYLELFVHMKDWSGGLIELKKISRWLCGRREETWWDDGLDDREWDLQDEPRRVAVPEFKAGSYEPDAYGQALLPELRAKMGVFRLKQGPRHLKEAMNHFELFYPEDEGPEATVYEYGDLFREIGHALQSDGHFKEALRFYEPLQKAQRVLEVDLSKTIALCYSRIREPAKAIECWESIIRSEPANVEVMMELAKAYEAAGNATKAYEHLAQVMRLGRRDVIQRSGLKLQPPTIDPYGRPLEPGTAIVADTDPDNVPENAIASSSEDDAEGSRPEAIVRKKPRKPRAETKKSRGQITKERMSQQKQYLLSLFERNEEIKPDMRDGDEEAENEWMQNAQILTEAFRQEKIFFPSERYIKFLGYSAEARRRAYRPGERTELDEMVDRLQNNMGNGEQDDLDRVDETQFIPTTYHGIEFSDWLATFCEYGILLARRDQASSAYSLLEAAGEANVFWHNEDHQFHLHVCIITAAIITADEEKLCNTSRFFMKKFPFATDSFRLYAALNLLFPDQPSWYNSGPSQKFMMRQIRSMDYSLLTPEQRANFKFPDQTKVSLNSAITSEDATPGNPHGLKEIEPALLLLYGHFLAQAASYSNALNYYFRAYAADRTNAMVVLSVAIAYMQHSMKRQCENRHQSVIQGVAFFGEYRRLRLREVDEEGSKVLQGKSDTVKAFVRSRRLMEVEYNEGRFWHHLGLLHLALEAYERCLGVEEPVLDNLDMFDHNAMDIDGPSDRIYPDPEEVKAQRHKDTLEDINIGEADFKREAAFAMQNIYALTGNTRGARRIAQKWLVF